MGWRRWLLLALLLCAWGWWQSPRSPRVPPPPAPRMAGQAGPADCPLPPLRASRDVPTMQGAVPATVAPFRLQAATLQPLAGFSVHARVLSRRDYRFDREARLSPTDLALGWNAMAEDAVLADLDISQDARWYRYRWKEAPPLPPRDIILGSANMHMIPSDPDVARALRRVRAGDRVRIDGWLVEARADDGWRWRSSMARGDTGQGACELVYVCAVTGQ